MGWGVERGGRRLQSCSSLLYSLSVFMRFDFEIVTNKVGSVCSGSAVLFVGLRSVAKRLVIVTKPEGRTSGHIEIVPESRHYHDCHLHHYHHYHTCCCWTTLD